MNKRILAFVPALFLSAIALRTAAGAENPAPRTVRWVVPHPKDDDCFRGLLEDFAKRIEQKSGGSLKVRFVDSEANSGKLGIEPDRIAYDQILNGDADITQISSGRLGVDVINMPYLFRSYEHAEGVWRGPVGAKLLEQVSAASDGRLKGLAFAYSGGFRALAGSKKVAKAADLKGLRMRETGGRADLLAALGVQRVKVDPAELDKTPSVGLAARGLVDLDEVEINEFSYLRSRFPEVAKKVKYVNLTRHSMLVTSLVVSERFLSSLSDDQRRLLTEEVAALGAPERLLAVDFAKANLARMKKEGVAFVNLPDSERRTMEKAAQAVYDRNPELAGIIQEIKAAKDVPLRDTRTASLAPTASPN